jgi:hypothetical protein
MELVIKASLALFTQLHHVTLSGRGSLVIDSLRFLPGAFFALAILRDLHFRISQRFPQLKGMHSL